MVFIRTRALGEAADDPAGASPEGEATDLDLLPSRGMPAAPALPPVIRPDSAATPAASPLAGPGGTTADEGSVESPPEPVATLPASRSELRRRRRRHRQAERLGSAAMPLAVAVGTLVLRLLTAATGPTDWDSAQYTLAVGHFDVNHGRPQPPGYWLYVEAGKLLHLITGLGTVRSLVLVAAVTSAAAAGVTALAGRDLGGRWVGLAAGLLVATSPFAWFSGSVVATYSFDMLACSVLIVLAWRARPNSWHGVAAVAALGVLGGFRQSLLTAFALLALIAVIGSTRRWSRLALTVAVAAGSVGVWLLPMVMEQPGGFAVWLHASHTESVGAEQITSVLDHAPGAATNFGTFAAYTTLALAPLAALALVAGLLLLLRRTALTVGRRRSGSWPTDGSNRDPADPDDPDDPDDGVDGAASWHRPWYQGRAAILAAAIVPPVAVVTLIQFAKGGYLLAYLPATVIALLLPIGALTRSLRHPTRPSAVGMTLASCGILALCALGAWRFLDGQGVLPAHDTSATASLWLDQPRYQAPYLDTRAAIRSADEIDTALLALAPSVRTGDVLVFDMPDGGANIYRNAGWALPADRSALITNGDILYNQLHGSLYYASGRTIEVGPGGAALLVASPALPGLAALTRLGEAVPVATPRPIGGYLVWMVRPGAEILGLTVVSTDGPRPLGRGLVPG